MLNEEAREKILVVLLQEARKFLPLISNEKQRLLQLRLWDPIFISVMAIDSEESSTSDIHESIVTSVVFNLVRVLLVPNTGSWEFWIHCRVSVTRWLDHERVLVDHMLPVAEVSGLG